MDDHSSSSFVARSYGFVLRTVSFFNLLQISEHLNCIHTYIKPIHSRLENTQIIEFKEQICYIWI